jgi:hypothetical protein
MKIKLNSIVLLFLSFLLCACEDVITLDLANGTEKYVIEAKLADQPGKCEVRIGKTKDFASSNNFNGQTGASVTIEDDLGQVSILTPTTAGIYSNPTLKGTPGHTYTLKIVVNGNTFTGKSTMPALVPLLDVYVKEIQIFSGPRKFTHVQYQDPAGKGDCYRFLEYVNGVYTRKISVEHDDLIDGNLINQVLVPKDFDDDNFELKTGDKIKVEFMGIDKPVYTYWFSVDAGAQGEGQTATPINPVTNLTGGALGYFSAFTFQSKEITAD